MFLKGKVNDILKEKQPEDGRMRELTLETKRLILRPWKLDDAEELYEYAKDPLVGPIAGWPVHTSMEYSRMVIQTVFAEPDVYAVVLKQTGKPIGSAGLSIGKASTLEIPEDEGEIGYWLGFPYWGQGMIPEAVKELLRYGFEERGLNKIWCAYFDGNIKSRRVQEKCGFRYHHTNQDIYWELMNEIRTEHVSCLTKGDWEKQRECK